MWQMALDEPDSAGPETIRRTRLAAMAVVGIGLVVLLFGRLPLAPAPGFANFHASVVLVVEGVTAFLLYGQFCYRRRWSYLVLGSGYLFSSLASIPFLLTFPGALALAGSLLGGPQSSIWVWHAWHVLFPCAAALAVSVDWGDARQVARERVLPLVVAVSFAVVFVVALLTVAVTLFHDRLPVLITSDRSPLTADFYLLGGVTVAVTGGALLATLRAARRHSVLYLWLAMVMVAYLVDALISVGSFARYTLAWYAGRVESMFAASALLFVFVNELNVLYRRLGGAIDELFATNAKLKMLVDEKEALLERVRASEEAVRRMAYLDSVTGLPNRRLAMDRLEAALAQAARFGHKAGLLFLDVDHFKEINDRYGHEVGDALLLELGARVENCVRKGDTVARFGGDEFVVILPELAEVGGAAVVARKVVDCLAGELTVLGNCILVTTSIGVATCEGDGCVDARELVRRADAAMYEAKQGGRNRYSVSPEG